MNPGLPTAVLVFILAGINFSSSVVARSTLKKNLMRAPHPDSCFHFYLTKPDGSHVVKKCNGGEMFDFESLQCQDRASAKCWKDANRRVVLKKPKEAILCPFPWGLYPDMEDCSHFHECLGGKAYLRKCPEFTAFDKAERTCLPVKEAMCLDESDVVEADYRCPYKWGYFPHPKDCSKYYECLRRVPTIRTCKRNMLFDNLQRTCIPMNNVKCGIRSNPYERRHDSTSENHKATKYSATGYSKGTQQSKIRYTTVTELPRSESSTITGRLITGYTAATERPRTGYTTVTNHPITGFTVTTKQPITGYTAATEQPSAEYTTGTDRPITGYTAATEQPSAGYTTGTDRPITGYTAATEQPRSGYTTVTESSRTGYTTVTDRPIIGYTAATEQPRSGYTTVPEPPRTGYTAATEQPSAGYTTVTDRLITGYTAATEQPSAGYTTVTEHPVTGYTAVTEHPITGYTTATERRSSGYTAATE